jgi:hypothetical protein
VGSLFSQKDRDILQSQKYDASLRPGFNALTYCLVWDDEHPMGVSREGHDVLATLWLGRRLMHQGLTFADHPVNPDFCRNVWQQAIEEIPDWPGFKRLTLNEQDRTYFEKNFAVEDPF